MGRGKKGGGVGTGQGRRGEGRWGKRQVGGEKGKEKRRRTLTAPF